MEMENRHQIAFTGRLPFFGLYTGDGSMAMDWLNWTTFYGLTEGNQLLVYNALFDVLGIGGELKLGSKQVEGLMVVENYDFGGWKDEGWGTVKPGDLGMIFRIFKEEGAEDSVKISLFQAVWGHLFTHIDVLLNFAKMLTWRPVDDPLVLDLDGDGIETSSDLDSGVYFDFDNNFFAERTGWLSGDDGFLVLDRDGNGRIEDSSEMFGGPGVSGMAALAAYDDNGDGVIDQSDEIFSQLKVWRDIDQDGTTGVS